MWKYRKGILSCEVSREELGKFIKRRNDASINGWDYFSKTDTFRIEASERIYVLLHDYLKEGYTPVNLNIWLTLKNSYAQRFYELLRLWSSSKDSINYKVSELRELLILENKYPKYSELRKRVIIPAIDELNSTGCFKINYEENKKGRNIDSVDFIVKDLDKRKYFTKENTIAEIPSEIIEEVAVTLDNTISDAKEETIKATSYKLALKYGLENKEKLCSKDFILKLNSIILDKSVNDYRKESVDIMNKRGEIVHEGLPYKELDKYMDSLIDFTNKTVIDPLISASIIHFYFVYIHPFIDGNGRSGRAYSYLYLVSKGLSNYNLFSISYMLPDIRTKYYNQLKEIQSNGYDLTEFITFMLHVMIDGLDDIENEYNLINFIANTKRIYKVFKLEYTDLTETMLNFLYTKDNFNKDKFYKKIRSKFIRAGYADEQLKIEIEKTLETLIKYQIIDGNYAINENLNSK